MLRLAVLVSLLALLPSPVLAQELSPRSVEATAHSLDNQHNECVIAQQRHQQSAACPTDTPQPTSTPRPTNTPVPTSPPEANVAVDKPTPTMRPQSCWLTDEQTGDPDNGYIVFVPLVYPDGSPALDEDGNPQYGPIPIPCDATPTPTPEPTDVPVAAAPPPVRPAPPRAALAPAPIAAPRRVLPPLPIAPTFTPTPEPTDVPTPAPTVEATSSATPTATPTLTATPNARPSFPLSPVASPSPVPTAPRSFEFPRLDLGELFARALPFVAGFASIGAGVVYMLWRTR